MTLDLLTRAAKGSALTWEEEDQNKANIKAAVELLQAVDFDGEGIADITSDGTSFTITGDKGTVWGPFTLQRGATWTSGSGAPDNGYGSNGDFYLDTDTEDVYLKSVGVWVLETNIKGEQGDQGDTGDTGPTGATGLPGGGAVLEYLFSTTTANADPGNGTVRLNNATQGSATAAYIDLLDNGGATVTTTLDALDDSTSTVKCRMRMVKKTDFAKWMIFRLTAVTTQTGYRELTLTFESQSGANPFSNGDTLILVWDRTGDKGDTGATGATGATGSPYTVRKNTFTPSAAAVTIDWSATDHAVVTLTDASTALTFTGGVDGQKYLLELIQGSGGSKVVTGPSAAAYGSDITAAPTLSTAAGKVDYLGYVFDNSAGKYRMIAYQRGY